MMETNTEQSLTDCNEKVHKSDLSAALKGHFVFLNKCNGNIICKLLLQYF